MGRCTCRMREYKAYSLLLITILCLILAGCGHSKEQETQAETTPNQYVVRYELPNDTIGLVAATQERMWFKENDVAKEMLEASYIPSLFFSNYTSSVLALEKINLQQFDTEWTLRAVAPFESGFWAGFYLAQKQSLLDGHHISYDEAVLVKYDQTGNVALTITLNDYTEPVVSILGTGRLQKKSELAQEYMDEGLATPIFDNCFPIGDMLCDDQGNLYVTGYCQDILVFSSDGELLNRIDCYDAEFDNVSLVKGKSSNIYLINRVNPDDEQHFGEDIQQYFRLVNLDEGILAEKQTTKFFSAKAALTSPIDNYEILEWNDEGIYGISLDGTQAEIEAKLIAKWENIGLDPVWLYPNGSSGEKNNPLLQYDSDSGAYIIEILLDKFSSIYQS